MSEDTVQVVEAELREVYELSILFDFYGELLGEKKKQIFEDYVLNDYSLAEVADDAGMSRQGVHDIVKRCTKALHQYEASLHLVEKFLTTKNLVEQIHQISDEMQKNGEISRVEEITKISEQILSAM